MSPMIGLPFLPIVNALESNVSATSKNLTVSPWTGDEGKVTVNPPDVVLQNACSLVLSVVPLPVTLTLESAPSGNHHVPL